MTETLEQHIIVIEPSYSHERICLIIDSDKVETWQNKESEYNFTRFEVVHCKPLKQDIKTRTCYHCGLEFPEKSQYARLDIEMWSRPFDETPTTNDFCSSFCIECLSGNVYNRDFNWFDCTDCGRFICEQNPSNGWHSQVRYLDDEYREEPLCLKCYEKHMFEFGIDTDELDPDEPKLQGMFFDDSELEQNGFTQQGDKRFVRSNATDIVNELIDIAAAGNIVIVSYEHMAYGGIEGTISIWAKPKPVEVVDK